MTILRRPGTIFPVHLPAEKDMPEKDRMVIWLKNPDQALYQEIETIADEGLGNFETGRRIIGLCVDRIDNVQRDDETAFTLDREKSGYLTAECAEWLGPHVNDIASLLLNLPRLTEVDQKNS